MKAPVGYGGTGFKALSGNADTGQAALITQYAMCYSGWSVKGVSL